MVDLVARDKVLIEEFLGGYNEYTRDSYVMLSRPDEVERRRKAIDFLAKNRAGETLAIEHTLIQPFAGERDDSHRFLSVIAPLEKDDSLRVPGRSIDVAIAVGSIPKGVSWTAARQKVLDWFRAIRLSLPKGQSAHTIPDLEFDLTLRIDSYDSPCPEGGIYVCRDGMPDDLEAVVRKALNDKLSKLARAEANRSVLLFEMDNVPRLPAEITEALERLAHEFSDLNKIDEAWCAFIASQDAEQQYLVWRVWPRSEENWPQLTIHSRP